MNGAEISAEVGARIRSRRKKLGLTIAELAAAVGKSKATVSKYEKGEITVDVVALYDLADALRVHVEQLLCRRQERTAISAAAGGPAFFNGVTQFYSYVFDGRSNQLIRCVFNVLAEAGPGRHKIMMFMNFRDFAEYENCENTYWGYIEHYDALTNIYMTNQDTPMEQARASILASYLDADVKWGLFCAISSRPLMPIAVKMLFSRSRLPEDEELLRKLRVSREDVRLLKLYNMFCAV